LFLAFGGPSTSDKHKGGGGAGEMWRWGDGRVDSDSAGRTDCGLAELVPEQEQGDLFIAPEVRSAVRRGGAPGLQPVPGRCAMWMSAPYDCMAMTELHGDILPAH
jgi:hypothetical protein